MRPSPTETTRNLSLVFAITSDQIVSHLLVAFFETGIVHSLGKFQHFSKLELR